MNRAVENPTGIPALDIGRVYLYSKLGFSIYMEDYLDLLLEHLINLRYITQPRASNQPDRVSITRVKPIGLISSLGIVYSFP